MESFLFWLWSSSPNFISWWITSIPYQNFEPLYNNVCCFMVFCDRIKKKQSCCSLFQYGVLMSDCEVWRFNIRSSVHFSRLYSGVYQLRIIHLVKIMKFWPFENALMQWDFYILQPLKHGDPRLAVSKHWNLSIHWFIFTILRFYEIVISFNAQA